MARRSKANAIDWDEARRKYEIDGMSRRAIAQAHGTEVSTFSRKALRDGWKLRHGEQEFSCPASGPGFVYMIGFADRRLPRYFKIGSASIVQTRLSSLQTSSPFELKVVKAYWVDNMVLEERLLHEKHASARVRGEWFGLGPEDVRQFGEAISAPGGNELRRAA